MPTIATLDEFKTRFPELVSAGDARLNLAIDDAEADTDPTGFDTDHVRAILLLSAHRIATSSDFDLNPVTGQVGAFSGGTGDGVSFSRVIPLTLTPSEVELWGSVHGQRFVEIRRRRFAGPISAG